MEVDLTDPLTAYAVINQINPSGTVFRTIDGGVNWTNITANLNKLPVWSLQIDPLIPATLYLGTDIGVYRSTDAGASWSKFGLGLPNAQVFQLELNGTLSVLAAAAHGRSCCRRISA
jgi:photosystem II stability/assembly factor-like uncharacterized protein